MLLASVLRVAGDRFTSIAVYFDQMELLTQLGLPRHPRRRRAELAY
jgi:hypothetical protein